MSNLAATADPHPPLARDGDGAGVAARSGEAREAERQQRLAGVRECLLVAAMYVARGTLLGLFALSGTVPWTAGLLYAGPGAAVSLVVALVVLRGTNRGLRDPSLAVVHSSTNAVLSLLGVALFPQLAFAYALILFALVLTATYRLPQRQVRIGLVVGTVLFAALTIGLGRKLSIPASNSLELTLSWVFFTMSLGRCVMLSVVTTRNNRLLRERGLEMKAKLAEIERLAHHDELTGVLNRRRLLQLLGEALARQDRNGVPVTVVLFDLDHFKAVNDTLGHQAGDKVLQRFAAAVQAQARTTDRFGRYGGEEFLAILHDTSTDAALQAIARVRGVVSEMDWRELSPELRVTFSAGIATYNGSESAELLLSRADLSLYEAKRSGRNCSRAL